MRDALAVLAACLLAFSAAPQSLDGPTPTATCTGKVIDDTGAPLAGAVVEARPSRNRDFGRSAVAVSASARTDDGGRFALELVDRCVFDLSVRHDGCYEFPRDDTAVLTVGSRTRELWIVLRRVRTTTFVAIDPDGRPVRGLELVVSEAPVDELRGGRRFRGASDIHPLREDGSVVASAEPALHAYRACAPGFAPRIGLVAFDRAGERRQTVQLVRESRVSGRVIRDGRPVADAQLLLVDQTFAETPVPEREEEWRNDLSTCFVARWPRGVSDRDGRFELAGAAAGTYVLEIRGDHAFATRTIELGTSATLDLGELELAEAPSKSVK